jgi:KDO2-lipid IV(A) lauroyltransferase
VKLIELAFKLGGIAAPKIPPDLGYAVCRLLGRLAYGLNRPGRRTVCRNLRQILGPNAPEAVIRQKAGAVFNHIFYNYFDLFRLPALPETAVRQVVAIDGWENVVAAKAGGQGILMTSAHLGNIEVVLDAMRQRGLAITIPVERVSPPALFKAICAMRTSKGLNLIPIDGPLLDLRRALKKGHVVGVAADRDITQTGPVVNFFGHPARLPDGHLRLALKTGAPLVVGFSYRQPNHTYRAYFLPPYSLPAAGSPEQRLEAGMAYITREMEIAIRRHPEQWTVTASIWVDNPSAAYGQTRL